jgi:cysteine desulfurase
VNNEIGTIQPVKEAAAIAAKRNIIFFTDAVQAVGHIPIDLAELGVNMLAFSGHKFGAPKGAGALYIKNGTSVKNLIDGGGQERKRRGGTESAANIAALASALEISVSHINDGVSVDRIRGLRDRLIDTILTEIPNTRLNGDRAKRIYSNVNVSIDFIEGESLILLLDMAGIAASTGSACSTDSLDPSHVLLAIGLPHETAHGSLRFSLSFDTTDEDVDYVLEKLPAIVKKLRDMSPLTKV